MGHEITTQTSQKVSDREDLRDLLRLVELDSRDALALLQREMPDIKESYLSEVINCKEGKRSKNGVKVKRALCRLVLLPAALALKIDPDDAWNKFGEHVLFGLPEPMKDAVLEEAQRVLDARSVSEEVA